jgi:hydroxymethylpyrimidine pyrophosphatase-like HAD family hydrolase
MRSILELEPAAAKALVGVVFDVDDTLTRAGRVEQAAYSALWSLREAGLALMAVTGRPLGFGELMARMWPIDVAVGENGAGYVRVTSQAVHSGFYAPEPVRTADAGLLARVRERVSRGAPFARYTDDSWARRCDVAWDIGERVQLSAAQIAILRQLIETEGARCVVSSVHAHAMTGDYDKAKGAVQAGREALGHDLDGDRERWLFVGDSGNDAPAFAHFPLSAAVANVQPYLSKLPVQPRYVSQADHGLGFAEIAAALLHLRR